MNKSSEAGRSAYFLLMLIICVVQTGCDRPMGDSRHDKQYKVGILIGVDVLSSSADGIIAGLEERGYISGHNIIFDMQSANGSKTAMEKICNRFVDTQVDLIVSISSDAVLAAVHATQHTDIPVVFLNIMDPVRLGLVKEMSVPIKNITGVYSRQDQYVGKRLEILVQLDPTIKTVWLPHNPAYPSYVQIMPQLQKAAAKLGLNLVLDTYARPEEVIDAVGRFTKPPFDAIIIFPDTTVQEQKAWDAIRAFAQKEKIPIAGNVIRQVEEGALFTYRQLNYDAGKMAAELAHKLLAGEQVAAFPMIKSLPQLILNLEVARQLGLEVNPVVLESAGLIIR